MSENPNVRVGIAMITWAPEAVQLHQNVAEEARRAAIKGQAAAVDVTRFNRHLFWTGLFVPVGTQLDVLKNLDKAVRASWQTTAVRTALRSAGDRPAYVQTDRSAAFPKSENDVFSTLIRDAKSKLIEAASVKIFTSTSQKCTFCRICP
ncbi:MAG: hypothetical protein H7238_16650 [Polaromonas sp.]|nr:hypothetical protein [Polaromonas sp.]